MNTPTLHRAAQFACALSSLLVLGACSSGGGDETPPVTPTPEGYIVTLTRVDPRTLDVRLSRTRDEPVLGLQCDLVFPPEFTVVQIGVPTKQALLEPGFAAVGRDQTDVQRVKVAAGQPGSDALRGTGELLSFRVLCATEMPAGLKPRLEDLRAFHLSDLGDFAVATDTALQWTVVEAQ